MNDGRVTTTSPDACPPAPALTAMPREEAERVARVYKAVADPTRVQLLTMIQTSPDGEACVCDLTTPLGLTQPTISHHLKILVDAGLLTRTKRGTWSWYSLNPDHTPLLPIPQPTP